MNNLMTYKGYTAKVEFDATDRVFFGRLLGIVDIISFYGATVQELADDFHRTVDHYQEDCERSGRQPHKQASGKLMLRVSPEIHAAAAIAAQAAGKSLNLWASEVLAQAAQRKVAS